MCVCVAYFRLNLLNVFYCCISLFFFLSKGIGQGSCRHGGEGSAALHHCGGYGCRAFVNKPDPSYVLLSSKVLKTMVTEKYNSTKEKTMRYLQQILGPLFIMDGYLGVT